jgi:hypothetical protein
MTLERFMESLSGVPYDDDLTPETLEFASGRAGASMPGSLYFESGRIRLVHDKGPKISKHEGIRRYSLSARGVRNLKRYKRRNWNEEQIFEGLKRHRNLHRITLNNGELNNGEGLIEFFMNARGKTRLHLSRGAPIKAPALKQVQIDLIARAADSHSNKVMKSVYPLALSQFK